MRTSLAPSKYCWLHESVSKYRYFDIWHFFLWRMAHIQIASRPSVSNWQKLKKQLESTYFVICDLYLTCVNLPRQLLIVYFKGRVKQFPTPSQTKAFLSWAPSHFHKIAIALPLSPLQENKNNGQTVHPLTLGTWIHQENGEKYPGPKDYRISRKKGYIKLKRYWLCGAEGEQRRLDWIFQKRLKTKDMSTGLPYSMNLRWSNKWNGALRSK